MALCRFCNAQIVFVRSAKNNKLIPMDTDNATPHFATCAARPRKDLDEKTCHKCGSAHTESEAGMTPDYTGLRCLDCGAHRWLIKRKGSA